MGISKCFCSDLHVDKLYFNSEFNLWTTSLLVMTVETMKTRESQRAT